jgi:HrpA-like RNA helicase
VIVTQPRRISATSVAERVATERVEQLGQTVGYAIRQEGIPPKSCGNILFCTTGVLTRKLTARRPGSGDLGNVSIVFVDEVHERDVHSDFLLIILNRYVCICVCIYGLVMHACMHVYM